MWKRSHFSNGRTFNQDGHGEIELCLSHYESTYYFRFCTLFFPDLSFALPVSGFQTRREKGQKRKFAVLNIAEFLARFTMGDFMLLLVFSTRDSNFVIFFRSGEKQLSLGSLPNRLLSVQNRIYPVG